MEVQNTISKFVDEIDVFIAANPRYSETTLSRIIFNDGKRIKNIRSGTDILTGTYDRAVKALRCPIFFETLRRERIAKTSHAG